MTIILSLLIPVSIVITSFLVLKSVQLGLRWQLQVQEKIPPTMDNPITPIVEARKEKQIEQQTQEKAQEQATVFKEWFNGAEEGR